jgi:hypothetical protein
MGLHDFFLSVIGWTLGLTFFLTVWGIDNQLVVLFSSVVGVLVAGFKYWWSRRRPGR